MTLALQNAGYQTSGYQNSGYAGAQAPAGDAGLFAAAERKLAWLDARQRVLARNIANSDTPGYRARDVAPFESHLTAARVAPARTSPLHLAGFSLPDSGTETALSEHAPDGNSVGLEKEMTKVADDEGAQALVGNLWKSYMGMYMTALGHGG
jgi:flagellar basal-body rod protein FlgB